MESDDRRLEGLKRVLEAFNRHDPDAITSRFADDCVLETPRGPDVEWTITGTTLDGERIEVRGCDLWTFGDDDKVTRKDSFWKIRELEAQP